MKKSDIVRALRNGEFFAELSQEERAQMPAHPVALPSVDDDVLNSVAGGCGPSTLGMFCTSSICTPCFPLQCSA